MTLPTSREIVVQSRKFHSYYIKLYMLKKIVISYYPHRRRDHKLTFESLFNYDLKYPRRRSCTLETGEFYVALINNRYHKSSCDTTVTSGKSLCGHFIVGLSWYKCAEGESPLVTSLCDDRKHFYEHAPSHLRAVEKVRRKRRKRSAATGCDYAFTSPRPLSTLGFLSNPSYVIH